MAPKGQHICALSIGEHALAGVRLRVDDDSLALVSQDNESGSWSYGDGSLAKALRSFVERNGMLSDQLYLVVPRHQCAVRIQDFPSTDDDELANMVRLTAEELVPFAEADLVAAFSALEESPDGGTRVLQAAMHRDVADAQLRVCTECGLAPEQLLLSTGCLWSAVSGTDIADERRVAFAHIADRSVEVLVAHGRKLEFARGVGLEQSADTPDGRDEALDEIRASLAAYRRTSYEGLGADEIRLSSDRAGVLEDLGSAEDILGLPCKPTPLPQGPNVSGDASPLTLIGAGLIAAGRANCAVELLPADIKTERAASQLRGKALRIAAMAAVVLVAGAAAFGQAVYQRSAYLAELEEQAEALRPRARTVIAQRRQLNRLQEQVARKETATELLGRVIEQAPAEGINMTRFSFRRDDGITVQGRAREVRQFDIFIDNLRSVGRSSFPLFAQAQETYRTLRKERNQDVWDYAIAIPFPELDLEEEADE